MDRTLFLELNPNLKIYYLSYFVKITIMDKLKYICKNYEQLSKDELYRILAARQEVFVVEQDIAYVDSDFKDQCSVHCWVEDEGGSVLAYLRIVEPGKKYKEAAIGRVLTVPAARGNGIGKELMKFGVLKSEERFKSSAVRISAQYYLEKFYQNLGFNSVSEPYIEEGIKHIEMLKD